MFTRHRRPKLIGVILVVLMIFGLSAEGCGSNTKTVHSDSQFYTCIFDERTGQLINQLAPGDDQVDVRDGAEVWRVPTSQRFYNIDPNRAIADPGAASYVTGVEAEYRAVQMVVHVKFYFNQSKICDWILKHGKRNVPPSLYGNDDVDKLGFNLRSDKQSSDTFGVDWAKAPWAQWLNENFGAALQGRGQPLLRLYNWPYYEFDFPVNADQNGVLPCNTPGDTPGSCKTYAAPADIARDVLEPQLSKAITEELNHQLNGQYFCGLGYDATKPDSCPPMGVEIVRIELVDKAPVADRQKIIDLRQQAQNDAEQARLTDAATTAAVAKKKAEIDQQKALDALSNQQQIDQATADKAVADAKAALKSAQSEQAARDRMANCTIVNANPDQCALIIAALNGQYPQGYVYGQGVTGNPAAKTG